MPKIIDPRSGKSKLYKGGGRSKDRNIGLYDTNAQRESDEASFDRKKWGSLGKRSNQTVPKSGKWQGRPMTEHRLARLQKQKRAKNRQQLPKPKKLNVPSTDSQGNPPQWTKGDRVVVVVTGKTATVINQILSNESGISVWSKVQVLYDDNSEGLCSPDGLRKTDGNTP